MVYLWQRQSWSRLLGNWQETLNALKAWVAENYENVLTVEMYDPSKLTLADALKKMCSCALVVHMHGGLLYHSITMQKDSAVIELVPRRGYCTTGVDFNLALQHEMWLVGVEGHRDDPHSQLDMTQFKSVLAEVGTHFSRQKWVGA